jgi:hypothetical protein
LTRCSSVRSARSPWGEWRLVSTSANRLRNAASYLKRPGDTVFRAYKFDVLRVQNGLIAEITTFDERLFPQLGLPATLDLRS